MQETISDIIRLDDRNKQLISKIRLINQYDTHLRIKYYDVLIHSIKLLLQNTLVIADYNKELKEC